MTKASIMFICFIFSSSLAIAQISSWHDPDEIKRIENDIEKYRKSDASITFIGKDGKPLRDATVTIRQQTHEFLFGCNLFVLNQLPTPELNRKYERAFTNLFNFATLPFYWRELEPEKNVFRFEEGSKDIWRRPPTDETVKWCLDHNIVPKGHALLYVKTKFMPEWIDSRDSSTLRELAYKRLSELAERYGGDVPVWDVTNEEIARLKNPEQWDEVPKDFLRWAFKKADSLFPKTTQLLINDETKTSHYDTQEFVDIVNGLLQQNIRVDGIGVQFHMLNAKRFLSGEIYTPTIMRHACEMLGAIEKPLWITEITIPSTGENGMANQADIVANIYKLWFSVPQMKGITWWNLGDGTAYESENNFRGGLLDTALNPKPSYKVLDQLINHEWKTYDTLKTDKNGKINFRGFRGKYSIQTKAGEETAKFSFQLSSNEKHNIITLEL